MWWLCATSTGTAIVAKPSESGRLRVDATRFVREDGSTFAWRGFSDFSLFHRFLSGDAIDAVLAERAALGANVLRVFGMYGAEGIGRANGLGALVPSKQPRYFDRLAAFLDLIAARGLRVEFVVFADAQELMPSAADQQTHLNRVAAVLAPRWNAIGEIVNEPFKNGVEPMRLRAPAGMLWASGEYAWDDGAAASHLDFVTWHPDRSTGWPSSAQAQMDMAARVRVPVVADEPLGFAEAAREGERSTSADEAAWFAAAAALAGAGATFHSDAGVASQRLGPAQKAAASAWFAGASWVPAAAQMAPRANDLLPDGARETICKRADGFSWCVAAKPDATWRPRPRNGCRVIEEPRRGLVKLACSGGNLVAMLFNRYQPD